MKAPLKNENINCSIVQVNCMEKVANSIKNSLGKIGRRDTIYRSPSTLCKIYNVRKNSIVVRSNCKNSNGKSFLSSCYEKRKKRCLQE